ncbi:hypothetical protein F5Y15DRAFT_384908, partial [Xylariaceae sp. FL0016]
MTYEDYGEPTKVDTIYAQEIGKSLLQYFQATSVRIFSIIVRRRHPAYPNVEIKRTGQAVQPASRVHIDTTSDALDELRADLEKTDENTQGHEGRQRRFIYLNVWKPLRGPLNDWPLALCDAATVCAQDLEAHDHIFPSSPGAPSSADNIVRENHTVYYNPNQKWY